jgi:hypothetical protein
VDFCCSKIVVVLGTIKVFFANFVLNRHGIPMEGLAEFVPISENAVEAVISKLFCLEFYYGESLSLAVEEEHYSDSPTRFKTVIVCLFFYNIGNVLTPIVGRFFEELNLLEK